LPWQRCSCGTSFSFIRRVAAHEQKRAYGISS
jgi:hypothetical protein